MERGAAVIQNKEAVCTVLSSGFQDTSTCLKGRDGYFKLHVKWYFYELKQRKSFYAFIYIKQFNMQVKIKIITVTVGKIHKISNRMGGEFYNTYSTI